MTVENMRTLYLDDRIVPLKVVFTYFLKSSI